MPSDGRIPLLAGRRPGAFPWSSLLGNLPPPIVEPLFWDLFSVGEPSDLRDRTPLVGEWAYEYPSGWDSFGPGGRVTADGVAVFDNGYGLSITQNFQHAGGLRMDVQLVSADGGSNWFEFGLSAYAPYGGSPPYLGAYWKYESGYLSLNVATQADNIQEIWRGPISFNENLSLRWSSTGVQGYVNGALVGSHNVAASQWTTQNLLDRRAFFRPMYYSSSQQFKLAEVRVEEL